jgi:stage IV sporulation protein B
LGGLNMMKIYKKCIIISILTALLVILISGAAYVKNNLPDTIFVGTNKVTEYNFSMPVSLDVMGDSKVKLNGKNNIYSGEKGDYFGKYKLFGIFALKDTNVKVVEKTYAYPVGLPVGLYLKTQGVMIIGTGEFEDTLGNKVSPAKDKVSGGEYIIKFNENNVSNKAQLSYFINENENEDVVLTVRGDNGIRTVKITPSKSKNGEYMLGIWVRDDSQGIGTITYVTEEQKFAALGHGISDIDTGKLLSSHDGTIYNANIWGVKKGEKGKPGGLCGTILYNENNVLGTIDDNRYCGLFGIVNSDIVSKYNLEKKEIALHNEIEKGEAQIQFISEGKINYYQIKIEEINENNKEKNMVIKITDEQLLTKTNGIVQGMSGSPIIQNGKIIGAVTHVMVNDPTKGYAIFAEQMIW